MEETLTVHRLHVPMQLRKTMASTNVMEWAFSIVEQVCRNVKRWHGSDQRERWVGLGLLVAEKQFRRVQGYKQIPALIKELEVLAPSKSKVVKQRKESESGSEGSRSFQRSSGRSPMGCACIDLQSCVLDEFRRGKSSGTD